MSKQKVSKLGRCISFGPFKVKLSRDNQLNYYKDDQLMRSKDVSNLYTEEELYNHVLYLAQKNGYKESDLKASN